MLDHLCRLADAAVTGNALPPHGAPHLPFDDPLNDYVEAHVHGGLRLERDVETLVVDPSDRHAHERVLAQLGCPVETHPCYRITADRIDPAYRGQGPVDLAHELGGVLTPARLAGAARSGEYPARTVKWL